MLTNVELPPKSLHDYAAIAGEETIEKIREEAKELKGARVLHINATAYGGGVAEILYTLVPLMRDVGLTADWQVIVGENQFFNVTKAFHNAMQGHQIEFTDEMRDTFLRNNELNAGLLEGDYDYVIVHDSQPAALLHYAQRRGGAHWVWRCHIDTSTPFLPVRDFLKDYVLEYDAAIYTMESYVGTGMPFQSLYLIPPSIDPLADKNKQMDLVEAQNCVAKYKIDTKRPLLVQVSRFDPWKDPLGVIDAYRMVKQFVPEVQLALVGSMASDDPEGMVYYARTLRRSGEDFDIHVLSNLDGIGNKEVNAFQTAADVVIQKSTREGFGLVVTEALWKGKPVVGGKVGGIPLQTLDGDTGFLVDTVEGCADSCLFLLQNKDREQEMGVRAKEHVRQNFLSTRHLSDYLRLFRDLAEQKAKAA